MLTRFCTLGVVLVLASATGLAQPTSEDLFVDVQGSPEVMSVAGSRHEVVERRAVGIRLDRLFGRDAAISGVALNVGAHRWTARFERLDRDVAGFRSWVGSIAGIDHSHVVFTERDGVVSGLINAVTAIYRIRTVGSGHYQLEQIDTTLLGAELEPVGGIAERPPGEAVAAAAADLNTIDVLLLFTPSARSLAGGAAQILAVLSQIISDSNTIFNRSGVTTRFRLVGTAEFGLVEAPSMLNDLLSLMGSTAAKALRDSTRADLVQLIVGSPDLSACGVAALLSSLTPSFEAYSVADVVCVPQYTPTHEMGHNMGSHHAPEDGAFGGLFDYSYGFKDPVRGFRTVMAFACPGGACPRIPNFSNPSVPHGGGVTGTPTQNNALSINNASATVANWRQGAVLPPPVAPTNLRTQVSGSFVSGAWDPSPGATLYTLQVGSLPGAANLLNIPVGNVTSFSGAVPAGLYYWRLVASNSAGSSPPSAESSFVVGCEPPGTPHSFTHSVNGQIVTLMWMAPSTGGPVAGYIIEAGSGPGLANLYNGPSGSTQPGGVTAAPSGTYFVRIRAQNVCGISGTSNEQVIIVP